MVDETLKSYLMDTKLTFSYKVVLVLVLIDGVDSDGKITIPHLIDIFRNFYTDRLQRGLQAERDRQVSPSPMLKPNDVSDEQIWKILTRYPIELMSDFIQFDAEFVRLKSSIWKQLNTSDLMQLKEIALQRIKTYYED